MDKCVQYFSVFLSEKKVFLQGSVPNLKQKEMDQFYPGTGIVLQAKTVILSSIKTGFPTFDKVVLHQKYFVERRSMSQIAREFASSKTTIRNALIRFEIPLRERWKNPHRMHNLPFGKKLRRGMVLDHEWEQKNIQSIVEMQRDGLSNRAIAKVLTAMKVPTKQRRKKWHYEMVRQILLHIRP